MVALARRSAGALARLLVLLLSLGTTIPAASHGDAGHDPCDAAESGSSAPASLHAVGGSESPRHCDVCHWLRSVRSFEVTFEPPLAATDAGVVQTAIAVSTAARLFVPQAPSRAPPA